MKITKFNLALGFTFLAIILSGLFFWKNERNKATLELPPETYATAQVDGISFLYPKENIVFIDNEFWEREVYERFLQENETGSASDTMPYMRVKSVESLGRSLEEIAIAEQQFGTEAELKKIDVFKEPSAAFSYGYTEINNKNVLWIHAAEKFDTTTYYFTAGNNTIIFSTLFSNEENLELIESMIKTVTAN